MTQTVPPTNGTVLSEYAVYVVGKSHSSRTVISTFTRSAQKHLSLNAYSIEPVTSMTIPATLGPDFHARSLDLTVTDSLTLKAFTYPTLISKAITNGPKLQEFLQISRQRKGNLSNPGKGPDTPLCVLNLHRVNTNEPNVEHV